MRIEEIENGFAGLVHNSELLGGQEKEPQGGTEVGSTLRVKILDVDLGSRRITLSQRQADPEVRPGPADDSRYAEASPIPCSPLKSSRAQPVVRAASDTEVRGADAPEAGCARRRFRRFGVAVIPHGSGNRAAFLVVRGQQGSGNGNDQRSLSARVNRQHLCCPRTTPSRRAWPTSGRSSRTGRHRSCCPLSPTSSVRGRSR
ncbi:hypothetical protein ACFWYX_26960 [[Kitasatospora] papulosa]|uniref:hypothetical protein n=1 Tax=[Kitasatospora] papulosa TaxID=1464011 RepID=UPI0036957AC1